MITRATPSRKDRSSLDRSGLIPGGEAWFGAAGAVAVMLTGGLVLAWVDRGPLSAHMAHHIGLMNVLAPMAAMLWTRRNTAGAGQDKSRAPRLWVATASQLALLWGWHLPAAQSWAMASVAGQVAMHGSLFLAALLFWMAVLTLSGPASWKSILALLVTGKLACLLGVILIFSPRLLYPLLAGQHVHGRVHDIAVAPSLADQQLAGLLMIAACPLSYLLAGVVIATRMINHLGRLDLEVTSQQKPSFVGQ